MGFDPPEEYGGKAKNKQQEYQIPIVPFLDHYEGAPIIGITNNPGYNAVGPARLTSSRRASRGVAHRQTAVERSGLIAPPDLS